MWVAPMLDLAKSHPAGGLGCARCGCTGLHACVGRHLPPPTAEDHARLDTTLNKAFGPFASDARPAPAVNPDSRD